VVARTGGRRGEWDGMELSSLEGGDGLAWRLRLGFHRPYYHLARIYFTQAKSKNGAPRRGFDLIKRFRLTIQTNGKRTEEGTYRKGHSSHAWAEIVYPTSIASDLVAIMRPVWFPALGFITPVLSIRRRVASQQASLFHFAYSRLSLRCYLETHRVMCLFYGYFKCSRQTLA